MSAFIVGDIQGCLDALLRLLDEVRFDPTRDKLYLAGDLVNRGPQSAETLRFVRRLGNGAASVLGNHDLHLLALAQGMRKGKLDTLDDILEAPDRDELLDWLRHQPLLVESPDRTWAMLHAGLPPQWSMTQARVCAREAESHLQSHDYAAWLSAMYGDEPELWSDSLSDVERFRFSINCFTRLRYCDAQGRMAPKPKGPPGTQPSGLMPWFAVPGRRSQNTTLVFGHWSTLGRVHWPEHRVYGLDTGCLWGGKLTALRLDDFSLHAVDCGRYQRPGIGGELEMGASTSIKP